MDIWLKPDNENKDKLMPLLKTLGIIPGDLELLRKTDFTTTIAFHIDEAPRRIDFLTRLSGIKYEEADKRKVFLLFF